MPFCVKVISQTRGEVAIDPLTLKLFKSNSYNLPCVLLLTAGSGVFSACFRINFDSSCLSRSKLDTSKRVSPLRSDTLHPTYLEKIIVSSS